MGYFLNFLSKNLEKVKQNTDEFYEDKDQARFSFFLLNTVLT
jgi:hypothetical protein